MELDPDDDCTLAATLERRQHWNGCAAAQNIGTEASACVAEGTLIWGSFGELIGRNVVEFCEEFWSSFRAPKVDLNSCDRWLPCLTGNEVEFYRTK